MFHAESDNEGMFARGRGEPTKPGRRGATSGRDTTDSANRRTAFRLQPVTRGRQQKFIRRRRAPLVPGRRQGGEHGGVEGERDAVGKPDHHAAVLGRGGGGLLRGRDSVRIGRLGVVVHPGMQGRARRHQPQQQNQRRASRRHEAVEKLTEDLAVGARHGK